MIRSTLFVCLLIVGFQLSLFGQSQQLIPVTSNAPCFIHDSMKETNIGICLNNYGISVYTAWQKKRWFYTGSVQTNTGNIRFNPLGLEEEPAIAKHLYLELGAGYLVKIPVGYLSFSGGLGYEITDYVPRGFLQMDYSHDAKYIRPGFSLRSSCLIFEKSTVLTVDPMVQFKIKLGKIRWTNQFGVVWPVVGNVPPNGITHLSNFGVFTVGIEYAW